MATAGAAIASARAAVETITAAAAQQPIAAALHTVAAAQPAATRQVERVRTRVTPKRSAPVPQLRTRRPLRTKRQPHTQRRLRTHLLAASRTAAAVNLTVGAASRMVVAADMKADINL
jgi:hypothetical protein